MRVAVIAALLALAFVAGANGRGATGFLGCRTFTSAHPTPLVRPHSIVVACGDGNLYVTGISWQSWNARAAAGTGTAHANRCTPNCAAGTFQTYRASVKLGRVRTCRGYPVFTSVTVHTLGGRGVTDSVAFTCD